MKKALIYGLSLALVLSLTACHKPQAEQTDQSEPIQAAISESVQDPAASPEPAENTAPEPEPEQTSAAPVETEASQPLEETTPPETPEETPEQSPKTAVPQTTPPTSQQPGSSYGDDLTPEQYAEIERQMWEAFEQGGGTIAEGRTEELTPEEEEYIGTILNGGTPQYNSTETQSNSQQQTQPSSTQKIDGHDDLGDYVLNGKGGKYYPALGITLPVSYDGQTHEGIDFSQSPDYKVGVDTAEEHAESWNGVSMGG